MKIDKSSRVFICDFVRFEVRFGKNQIFYRTDNERELFTREEQCLKLDEAGMTTYNPQLRLATGDKILVFEVKGSDQRNIYYWAPYQVAGDTDVNATKLLEHVGFANRSAAPHATNALFMLVSGQEMQVLRLGGQPIFALEKVTAVFCAHWSRKKADSKEFHLWERPSNGWSVDMLYSRAKACHSATTTANQLQEVALVVSRETGPFFAVSTRNGYGEDENRADVVTVRNAFGDDFYLRQSRYVRQQGGAFVKGQINFAIERDMQFVTFKVDRRICWTRMTPDVFSALGFIQEPKEFHCVVLYDNTVIRLDVLDKDKWPAPDTVKHLAKCQWVRQGSEEGENPYYLLTPCEVEYGVLCGDASPVEAPHVQIPSQTERFAARFDKTNQLKAKRPLLVKRK